ncbi:hypothetical protein LOZ12_000196 [Ophidiomyces ophidiicola]|uniref:Uncharacterized protein n=1 Tax=Ophidiomyces ophidiicola TaxID=1387563 RepID=A0ACB8URL6_9EURO|nr:hypothetical protein LOZ62_006394 [Ophidiomyces ophidiicola]KAI1965751.1 hypothetical protein LOZ56_005944 [Ophidiomyces ophidiicola]KAI2000237.1 hypothetical protein LOZ50_006092 [Ophidiomyces ophidiicola]KAI2023801.1 hypothetical protein LOZ45_003800 [Ophidiomyces ophidiicola]KAI2038652.1 hypothetical protein LOZ47_003032 [Ophidiomyces ophidiicola]
MGPQACSELQTKIPIAYDLTSHHALGGGSYVFKNDYPAFLKTLVPNPNRRTEINIVIQPNNSPHIGTLCSLSLAFVVAHRLKDLGMDVLVTCDLWDRAKGSQEKINGIVYQKCLQDTGTLQKYLQDYQEILRSLSRRYGILYKLRLEEEFLKSPEIPEVIQAIIKDRSSLAKVLAPLTGKLAIRSACPTCGLVDKYGAENVYADDGLSISFNCPHHGRFSCSAETECHRLQFNCQLFNLVMGRVYECAPFNYIEICGSDYAGFWQEQLLWRFLSKPIITVYTPLIHDWSGSKVSKSLYLQNAAYDYLRAAIQDYLLSYRVLRQQNKDLSILWEEVGRWVDEPYRLFRGYSLHYIHLLFEKHEISLGVIHKTAQAPEIE